MHFRQNAVRAAVVAAIVGASATLCTTAATADGMDKSASYDAAAGSDRPQFSVNATIASDYRFRGFTQTREKTALQGGFDATWRGFYAGVWASNVDFGSVFDGTGWRDIADVELVSYVGMKRTLHGTELDLRAIYYAYPGSHGSLFGTGGDLDYFELMVGVSREIHTNLTADLKVYYSPDYFGEVGKNWVIESGLTRKLGTWGDVTPSLSARLGRSLGDEDKGGFDYYYWNAGMSFNFHKYFEFDIRYFDTFDIPSSVVGSCKNLCDGRVVARITFEN